MINLSEHISRGADASQTHSADTATLWPPEAVCRFEIEGI